MRSRGRVDALLEVATPCREAQPDDRQGDGDPEDGEDEEDHGFESRRKTSLPYFS
jgi:hypothetical protein